MIVPAGRDVALADDGNSIALATSARAKEALFIICILYLMSFDRRSYPVTENLLGVLSNTHNRDCRGA